LKTFNATELNKNAAKIFRAVDQEGSVKINHDRYPDKVFIIEGRARRAGSCDMVPAYDFIIKKIDMIGRLSPKDLRFMEITRKDAHILNIQSNVKFINFRGVDLTIVNELTTIEDEE